MYYSCLKQFSHCNVLGSYRSYYDIHSIASSNRDAARPRKRAHIMTMTGGVTLGKVCVRLEFGAYRPVHQCTENLQLLKSKPKRKKEKEKLFL